MFYSINTIQGLLTNVEKIYTVLFIREHETFEYIPSPFRGDENVLAKVQVLQPVFGFMRRYFMLLHITTNLLYEFLLHFDIC